MRARLIASDIDLRRIICASKPVSYTHLVAHKTHELFDKAGDALEKSNIRGLEEQLIFIIDNIIDALVDNKPLLNFISKNLVMGALRSALITGEDSDGDFYDKFLGLVMQDEYDYEDVDVMLFTIVELAGSAGYNSCLLYTSILHSLEGSFWWSGLRSFPGSGQPPRCTVFPPPPQERR